LGRALLEQAYPYKDSGSYALCNFGYMEVSSETKLRRCSSLNRRKPSETNH
jgi:hypothetical protein